MDDVREESGKRMRQEKPVSNYLIACDEKDKERQKELLFCLLGPVFFGSRAASDEKELNQLFQTVYGIDAEQDLVDGDDHYEEYMESLQAIREGLHIYLGQIPFDESEVADLALEIWDVYETLSRNGFRRINTNLEE